MPEFQGKLRLIGDPLDVVKADIEVEEGSFSLIVSDHEVGEWPLGEVAVEVAFDGFHVHVDGEEFVFTTLETDAFARAVGVEDNRAKPSKNKRKVKQAQTLKNQTSKNRTPKDRQPKDRGKPQQVKVVKERAAERQSEPARAQRPVAVKQARNIGARLPIWLQRATAEIDFSNPLTKKVGVGLLVFLVLAIVARGLLATLLLGSGMIALVLAAGAIADPLVAARFPNDWSPMRVIRTGLVALAAGLLLIAF